MRNLLRCTQLNMMALKVMRHKEGKKKTERHHYKSNLRQLPCAACKTEDFNSFLTLILDFCSETHNSKTNGVESFHQLQPQHNSDLKKKKITLLKASKSRTLIESTLCWLCYSILVCTSAITNHIFTPLQ